MLVLTTTEVDKTGASYYGEQGLHYLSAKGEGNIVLLGTCTCSYVYPVHNEMMVVLMIERMEGIKILPMHPPSCIRPLQVS